MRPRTAIVQREPALHIAMTSNTLLQPTEIIHLSGISWQTYENLLTELSASRRLRLTYNRGTLEIMVPSPEHESYKKVLGRFVETLAEELEVNIQPVLLLSSAQNWVEQNQMNVFTLEISS